MDTFFANSNSRGVCTVSAVTCRLDPTKPLRTFFEPGAVSLTNDQKPYSAQIPWFNAAMLFHEALHGFLQLQTDDLLHTRLQCTEPIFGDSRDITIFLQQFVGPKPPSPLLSCTQVENGKVPANPQQCVRNNP